MGTMKSMLIEQLNQEREEFKQDTFQNRKQTQESFEIFKAKYEDMLSLQQREHARIQEEKQLGLMELVGSKIDVEEHKRALLELNMVHAAAADRLKKKVEQEYKDKMVNCEKEYLIRKQELENNINVKIQEMETKMMKSEYAMDIVSKSIEEKNKKVDSLQQQLTTEKQARIGFEAKLKEACKHLVTMKSMHGNAKIAVQEVKEKLKATKIRKSASKKKLVECNIVLVHLKEQSQGQLNLLAQQVDHYKGALDTQSVRAERAETELGEIKVKLHETETISDVQRTENGKEVDRLQLEAQQLTITAERHRTEKDTLQTQYETSQQHSAKIEKTLQEVTSQHQVDLSTLRHDTIEEQDVKAWHQKYQDQTAELLLLRTRLEEYEHTARQAGASRLSGSNPKKTLLDGLSRRRGSQL